MIVIAKINIAGATNRRDIIHRLMDASEAFANMTFATAAETFRSMSEAVLCRVRVTSWSSITTATTDNQHGRRKPPTQ